MGAMGGMGPMGTMGMMGSMNAMGYPGMGYMPSNYYMNIHPLSSFGGIEACQEKFPYAWGHSSLKSGELPPATPDPSNLFKEGS